MSLFFKMLSRLVIAFLPRSNRLLISWLQSPSAVILEPKKIKSVIVWDSDKYYDENKIGNTIQRRNIPEETTPELRPSSERESTKKSGGWRSTRLASSELGVSATQWVKNRLVGAEAGARPRWALQGTVRVLGEPQTSSPAVLLYHRWPMYRTTQGMKWISGQLNCWKTTLYHYDLGQGNYECVVSSLLKWASDEESA